ncbi:ribonuclease III [Stanieria cyanosphaera PCC 7437]|uniref:Mini-ribonuclease 3 n=1 Tax=Stanieria cyanosphaera (strain ATCC 29371 / PCC 7437) TaxID=111780 RepID=K9XW01_STAC7|nr:ribonuclease III domain-containing protein [Stanieria cyanosphaera]AFZ36244.1 ribonuclease III [Stanieria cyanosphaera PCC 7437]
MSLPKPDRDQPELTTSASVQAEASLLFNQMTTSLVSQVESLSPIALAYIGDAVYELYVRTCYLIPPKRLADYHNQVVAQVRAESQADYLQLLQPYLTFSEQEIVRRGRNAVDKKPRRISAQIYQQATSFETLLGYLYLTNPQRLDELLAKLKINSSKLLT